MQVDMGVNFHFDNSLLFVIEEFSVLFLNVYLCVIDLVKIEKSCQLTNSKSGGETRIYLFHEKVKI